MKTIYCIAAIGAFFLGAAASSHGQVLFTDNFDSYTSGSAPAGWVSTTTPPWKVSSAASASGTNSYWVSDTVSAAGAYSLATRSFSTLTALNSNTTVNLQFDLRIDSYQGLTAGSGATFRVAIQADGTAANQYAIGLGYANVGSSPTLFFYAGAGQAPVPTTVGSASNAIGYQAGTGFAPGFDLGAMGSATTNGTGENFYHFDLTYNSTTGAVDIVVTNLANPLQKATFSDVWKSKLPITTAGQLVFTTGSISVGEMYVDNVQLAAIPEPSSLVLLGICGATFLGLRGRQRSQKSR